MMKNSHSEEIAPLNGSTNGSQIYALSSTPQTVIEVEDDEEDFNLLQLWSVVRRRSRLIAAITVGVTIAAGVWTFLQEPRYRNKFQILIESPTAQSSSNDQIPGLGLETVDYDTQIKVLLSPSVVEPIVAEIASQYPEINYKNLTGGETPLTIEQLDQTKILEVSYEDEDPEQVEFVLEQVSQGYLDYSLGERQDKITRAIQFVKGQLPRLQDKVDNLQEKLQNFRQQYNLLDPENQANQLSQQLVNLEAEYFDTSVKLNETRSLYQILQNQLGLDPQGAIAASYLSESPRYQKLLNQLQEVEIELANQSAIFQANTPTIEALQEKKQNLLPLLQQEAQAVLGNRFSEYMGSNSSLASPSELRLDLNQKFVQAANEIQILELRKAALAQAVNQLNQQSEQMPVLARQYTDLQRELGVATERLNRFLAAEQDLELASAKEALPAWKIIAPPEEPKRPVFPQPIPTMSLGFIGGLLLGLGAAFLAERLDPVFHSSDELQDSIKLPILAHIPIQKDLESVEQVAEVGLPQLQIGDSQINFATTVSDDSSQRRYKSSPFLEAFRSLNTNIRLLGSDTGNNSIVVSSSAPAEGKSTISSHLARAAADMGQRVLLVDADLRRPQVHKRLGLAKNGLGLSNAIADGLDLEKVIQRVPHQENLFVLTAGENAPDPPRLLASRRMQQIMEQLQISGAYDLIIYDTPPLLGFADGRILAPATKGVILVVRMDKTDRSALKQTIEQVKMSQSSVLGLVANGISRHGHGSHYYDHYYRYYQDR